MKTLSESSQVSAVEVKPETSVSNTEMPTSLEEDAVHEQVLVDSANLDSQEAEDITPAEPFETQVVCVTPKIHSPFMKLKIDMLVNL